MLEFIEDQFPYLSSCDIIIAPGGHSTTMEAMSFGIPMLSVPDMNHSEQRNNASALEKDSLGKMIEYSASAEDILRDINEVLQDNRYRENVLKRRRMAQKLEGAAAIRKMLESKHKGRKDEERKTKKHFALSKLRKKTLTDRMQKKRN
jgi:UDP:flavonoid glycosyltransferase YjiC (YdhE family)